MRLKEYLQRPITPEIDRAAYTAAAPFLARMKVYRDVLDYMQWKSLREQALSGDVEGAAQKLEQIIREAQQKGMIQSFTYQHKRR